MVIVLARVATMTNNTCTIDTQTADNDSTVYHCLLFQKASVLEENVVQLTQSVVK